MAAPGGGESTPEGVVNTKTRARDTFFNHIIALRSYPVPESLRFFVDSRHHEHCVAVDCCRTCRQQRDGGGRSSVRIEPSSREHSSSLPPDVKLSLGKMRGPCLNFHSSSFLPHLSSGSLCPADTDLSSRAFERRNKFSTPLVRKVGKSDFRAPASVSVFSLVLLLLARLRVYISARIQPVGPL